MVCKTVTLGFSFLLKYRTVGNVCDFAQDVVSANLFVTLWWTDQGLTDHGDVDFSTNTSVVWL